MYEKYFKEIVSVIQKKVPCRDVPAGASQCGDALPENVFTWAQANAPELYAQERALDVELNALWDVDFTAFKAKVVAWGRVVLGIYKKATEVKK